MNFVKSNYIFIIWLIFYTFVLAVLARDDIEIFYTMLALELLSLVIAFSPIGERLLRIFSGARRIKSSKDCEYLLPIFEEVYNSVKENNPKISRNVKLYIDKDKSINAYAFGRNSISVTRGAMEILSKEQLKGVLAHEFGHINNGDTKVTLVMTVGNGAFTALWLILKFVMTRGRHKNDLSLVFAFNAIISFIVSIFIAIGNRRNEYMADKFAYENGFGDGLLETLYFFREMRVKSRLRLAERLKSSHPDLKNRIKRLEELGDSEDSENAMIEHINEKTALNPKEEKTTYTMVTPMKYDVSTDKRKIENLDTIKLTEIKTINAPAFDVHKDINVRKLEARITKYVLNTDNFKKEDIPVIDDDLQADISTKIQEAIQLKEREAFWDTIGNSDWWNDI